ncbi:MAG: FAD-dependent oxidoreductase [Acidobacteriaceae bacterium]|nr:FAD-dependent oxidoreductase [Acidobacteriaceae bacterium]
MMMGYLLARAGVDVSVLEKHGDFFRDFRGDTVHPSTLQLFSELGLAEDLLRLPHQRVTTFSAVFGDFAFRIADFSHLPLRYRFVAFMPQWDFLNFLAENARKFPNFHLEMEHEAVDLLWRDSRAVGVVVKSTAGTRHITADLVVGCDGRHSTVRRCAGLEMAEAGVPIDVLWFRLARHGNEPERTLGRIDYGKMLLLLNRGDYFQAGLLIRKGSFEQIQTAGLPSFRDTVAKIAPFLRDSVGELQSWDQVKLLTVQINHLRRWYRPGLLCIGDAAHAMSPAWGVGINYAIQDAVAAARILGDALQNRRSTDDLLPRIQKRREFPVRAVQFLQERAHAGFANVFDNSGPMRAPWQLKLAVHIPGIQRIVGRAIGIGLRPEHIGSSKPKRATNRAWIVAGCSIAAGLALLTAKGGFPRPAGARNRNV